MKEYTVTYTIPVGAPPATEKEQQKKVEVPQPQPSVPSERLIRCKTRGSITGKTVIVFRREEEQVSEEVRKLARELIALKKREEEIKEKLKQLLDKDTTESVIIEEEDGKKAYIVGYQPSVQVRFGPNFSKVKAWDVAEKLGILKEVATIHANRFYERVALIDDEKAREEALKLVKAVVVKKIVVMEKEEADARLMKDFDIAG